MPLQVTFHSRDMYQGADYDMQLKILRLSALSGGARFTCSDESSTTPIAPLLSDSTKNKTTAVLDFSLAGQNITSPSSDVVLTIRSALNNINGAFSSLEGVAEGCIECIRGVSDSLYLANVQLRQALILLGNNSQVSMIGNGTLIQNTTTEK